MGYQYLRLGSGDEGRVRALLEVFRVAFDNDPDYAADRSPEDGYIAKLLSDARCIVLVAQDESSVVVGGLVAYELPKFEQPRSEVYVYDLAVAEAHRRRGVATDLLSELRLIAQRLGAHVIFIQADKVDVPAVALYTKLSCSVEPNVIHFDIAVDGA